MPRRAKHPKKGSRGKSAVIASASAGFSPSSSEKTAYTGPLTMAGSAMQNAPIVTQLQYTATIVSDGIGTIVGTYTNNPNAYLDFSTFASLYDEYRYLGIELEFFPNNRYSKVTTVCKPGVGIVDRDDIATLTSIAAGLHYESCRVLSLEDPWTDRRDYKSGGCAPSIKMKMTGVREAAWITTATPVATGAIKIRFENLSATIEYGLIVVRGLFQFRGRD